MSTKERNYTPVVIGLSVVINLLIAILFFMPKAGGTNHVGLTILPLLNAVLNSFTFVFLIAALFAVKKNNIRLHRGFVAAAFTTTFLFLISYVTYHYTAKSTPYGGEGFIRYVYFFILLSHILLSVAIVPLALITAARGLNNKVDKHRRIARWTMPVWLYVSLTGIIVYLMISPYYS